MVIKAFRFLPIFPSGVRQVENRCESYHKVTVPEAV